MKLHVVVEFYINFLKLNRGPATHSMYEMILGKLVNALGGGVELNEIAPHDLDLALLNILRADMAVSTRAKYKRTIRAFFNWVVERNYRDRSPVMFDVEAITPGPLCLEKAIPEEDIDRMLNHARNSRDYALVRLLRDTGLRRGALHSLKVRYINLERRTLSVREKGNTWHTLPLADETLASLEAWLDERKEIVGEPDHGFVFVRLDNGRQLTLFGLGEILRRIGKRAGVTLFSSHKFRHAWGAWAATNGVPITVAQAQLVLQPHLRRQLR